MKIPNLPDTKKWQPRQSSVELIRTAFYTRCKNLENSIIQRLKAEVDMNIDNFDSGIGFEEIIRNEFIDILPKRYSVEKGVLVDRNGQTAGDCDLLVFNEFWFPKVKSGVLKNSNRVFIPIEGTYAVGEMKQTLDYKSLDDALKKLVISHRLNRPNSDFYRLVENRQFDNHKVGSTNPLYSFIIAANIRNGIDFEDLINRFFDINQYLSQFTKVRLL